MTVAAPPRPPQPKLPVDPDTRYALEALIEEARRRARRRRQRYAASLLAAGVVVGAFFALRGGGDNSAEPETGEPGPPPRVQVGPARPRKNGELTIMDYRQDASTVRAGGGRRDWYGLSTIDRNGELRPLVRCPDGRDWCGWVVSADWSPDGRQLALAVTTLNTPNPNGIHIIDVSTGVDRHIGQAIAARDLDWSPDGRRLAYAERGVIKVIEIARGGPLPQIVAEGASPSWSPDGAWIAYATGRLLTGTATPSRVQIMRPDGTDKRLVVADGAAPAWSPLGDVIAYRSSCGINLVTPDGRDMTPPSPLRCNAIGVPGTPVWSPDGKKIAIGASPTRPGLPYGTFVMNADGSNLLRLTGSVHTTEGFAQPRPTWRPRP